MSSQSYDDVRESHGILGSLAWVIFFPLGAIVIRLVHSRHAWLIHAAIQAFAAVLFTVNFGEGVWMVMKVSRSAVSKLLRLNSSDSG